MKCRGERGEKNASIGSIGYTWHAGAASFENMALSIAIVVLVRVVEAEQYLLYNARSMALMLKKKVQGDFVAAG